MKTTELNVKHLVIVLITPLALCAVTFEFEILGGYGFPAARDKGYPSSEIVDTLLTYQKDNLVSHGNGLKFDLSATCFINPNWGVILGTGVSLKGGYEASHKYSDDSTVMTQNLIFQSRHIPLFLGLKFIGGNKKIAPYVYAAPGVIFPLATEGDIEKKTTVKGQTEILTTDITREYNPGFSFFSGLGLSFKISKKLSVLCECSSALAAVKLMKEVVTFEENGQPYTIEYIFLWNEHDLPEDKFGDNYEILYEHGDLSVSFSSIALKLGFSFTF